MFFGEQFGLSRNPAFAPSATGNNGNGKGRLTASAIRSPRQSGAEQTLGDKPFIDDMRVPGMLHGAMVLSEHPRARVLKIHTDEAAAMAGVVRVLTAADVPGFRGQGLNDPDQPVFVAEGELTCCVADFLAMVVADTQFHARQAAAKVRVDYEVLEPLTDPFEALKPGAPLVHPADTFARGRRTSCNRRPPSRGVTSMRRWPAQRTSSKPRSRRSRSRSRSSSLKRAWSCPRAASCACSPTVKDRSTTTSRSPSC